MMTQKKWPQDGPMSIFFGFISIYIAFGLYTEFIWFSITFVYSFCAIFHFGKRPVDNLGQYYSFAFGERAIPPKHVVQ